MARVSISEYKAKRLLLGSAYTGWQVDNKNARKVVLKLPKSTTFVVKVDQGVKKRFKQGLLSVNVAKDQLERHIKNYTAKGYRQFLIEPYVPHLQTAERYLSLERVREGIKILYSLKGGVDIEDSSDSVLQATYNGKLEILADIERALEVNAGFLEGVVDKMNALHISFIEINPLLVVDSKPILLDCAAMVDSTASWFVGGEWSEDDFIEAGGGSPQELAVRQLSENSPSSLTLRVLNPNGSLFMLLSGGGASIALADEAFNLGFGAQIANYGEYSGNPTLEETYLYTKQILSLLLESEAKKKALVIAGGVANFTDVSATFKGIIQALDECKTKLKNQKIKVYVRRGGPNEAKGLAMMKDFLASAGILGSVAGSEELLVTPVRQAVASIK